MTQPKRIVHQRPYGSLEELIEAEAWSITRERLVLVGHPAIPDGSPLRVDLVLASGERVLRAEGKVVDQFPSEGDRTGGPRLALRRVTRDSQKLINLASAHNGAPPPRGKQFSLLDMDIDLEQSLPPPVAEVPVVIHPPEPELEPPPPPEPEPEPPPEVAALEPSADEQARAAPVEPPEERETLLERLRQRWSRRNSD
ncbi:MAG: hypothetical protein KC776_27605 [Myxococcales bacterium]|nr:hypothetical protein [Myxococcales bacterium]MCB9576484.1 hypothetical protein [Polyangiaceae bacterium]